MLKFRNSVSNYKETPSIEIVSEEYTHTEERVNGQIHMMGTKKQVNLCNNQFAKSHFPNPKDYTLENLIASGANLQEVSSSLDSEDEQILMDAEKLSKKYEETNKEE